MTRHCSFCSACLSRSSHWRPAGPLLLVVVLTMLLHLSCQVAPLGAACSDCGVVSGSISVERASIRSEGDKHDRDVVVSLEPVGNAELPLAAGRAEMDQEKLVFKPHVLAVEKGTTVRFLNSDNEQHNVYFLDDRTGDTLDIGTWGPGVSVEHRFTEPGTIITLCKLHLEMAAYIVVLDSPWFVTTQLDPSSMAASYTIAEVPAGRYRLRTWHKKLKQLGGELEVEVRPGEASTADVVITKAKYAK